MESKEEYPRQGRKIKNLVFEGGGIKGIAYAGAISVLEENNLLNQVENVAGASVGSIAALLVGLGYDSKTLLKIMNNLNFENLKDSKRYTILGKTYDLLNYYGLYEGDVIKQWFEDEIRTALGNSEATFEDLHAKILENKASNNCSRCFREMYFVGTNLSTRHYEIFSFYHTPKMKLSDAVRISLSIPMFFKAIPYGEKNDLYVDGGVLHNYPIDLFDAGREQNDETLGFRLDPPDEIAALRHGQTTHKPIDSVQCYGLAMYEALLGTQNTHFRFQEEEFRTIFINTLNVGTTQFDIDQERKNKLVEQGEIATREFIKKYMSPFAPMLPIQKRQIDAKRLAKTDRYKMFAQTVSIYYNRTTDSKCHAQLIFTNNEIKKVKKYVQRLEQQPDIEEVTFSASPPSKIKLAFPVINIIADATVNAQIEKWIRKNKTDQKKQLVPLSMSELIVLSRYRSQKSNLKLMPAQVKPPSKVIFDAVQANDVALLEKLLLQGHSPLYADQFGATALHYSAESGYVVATELLLKFHSQDLINFRDLSGETPLYYAAYNGQVKSLQALLEHSSPDINVVNRYGATPLHRGARFGHLEIVKLLVENGADINIIDNENETAAQVSAKYNHKNVTDYLSEVTRQQESIKSYK